MTTRREPGALLTDNLREPISIDGTHHAISTTHEHNKWVRGLTRVSRDIDHRVDCHAFSFKLE